VSTSPSITEALFALGLGGRVIGVSSYCRYPAEVASLPDVGSFLRPSTELIARLRPDLVIVNRASTDVARQLTALRLRAIAVDEARSLASVYAMIREIGRAAGIADRADALVAELLARLDRVRARACGRPRR
jgi:iron complex transport system substrate-binding protein